MSISNYELSVFKKYLDIRKEEKPFLNLSFFGHSKRAYEDRLDVYRKLLEAIDKVDHERIENKKEVFPEKVLETALWDNKFRNGIFSFRFLTLLENIIKHDHDGLEKFDISLSR